MKFIIMFSAIVMALFLAAFVLIGLSDVTIDQKQVVKEIPHDRFQTAP